MSDRFSYEQMQGMPDPRQMGSAGYGMAPQGAGGNPWQQAMTPTGAPNTSGVPDSGMQDLTGFAGQYQGLPLWETIYDDPTAILPDVFPGIDPYGQGYNMLSDLPFDPAMMYLMNFASDPGTAGSGVNEYTNYLASMYQGLGGGQWFNFGDLMGNITGAGNGSELSATLANLPAGEAASLLKGMLGAAATVGLNPWAARAFQNMIPGMFAGMSNNAIKTPLAQQGQGFNDPMGHLQSGLARSGFGF